MQRIVAGLKAGMKERAYLLLILLLHILLNMPFLTVFPPIDNVGDESWMTNISLELLKTGSPLSSMHIGTPVAKEVQVITTWIYSGMLSGVFAILTPSVWAGRFLSFLFGLFVIILIYNFGKALVDQKVGLTASLLLVTANPFSWHSREIRPEMMLMAFTTLSVLFFYLAYVKKKNIFLFFSGLISTLSVQVHPNGTIFAFSIVLIYFFVYRKRLFSLSSIVLFAGLLTGFSIWLIFNYLPYSTESFQTIHKKYLPPILYKNFFVLLKDSVPLFKNILSINMLEFIKSKYYGNVTVGIIYLGLLLIVTALVTGKNRKSLLFVLSFLLIPLIFSIFIINYWTWLYFSIYLPFIFLALAISLLDISRRVPWLKVRKLVLAGSIILFAGTGIFDIMTNNLNMLKYDFKKIEKEIAESVPRGTTVMGTRWYYFAFLENQNHFVTYTFLEEQCPDFESMVRAYKIDYILVDDIMISKANTWCTIYYTEYEIKKLLEGKASLTKDITFDYPSGLSPGVTHHVVSIYKVNL